MVAPASQETHTNQLGNQKDYCSEDTALPEDTGYLYLGYTQSISPGIPSYFLFLTSKCLHLN